MLIDKEGYLWTGGPGGVNRNGGPGVVVRWDFETGDHRVFTPEDGLPNAFVLSMSQTGDGAIWVSTWGGGIARYDGEDWQTFTTEDGLPSNYIAHVVTRSDGSLWVNTHNSNPFEEWAFGRFIDGQWIEEAGGGFDTVIAATDGSFWASHYETQVGHFLDGNWIGLGISKVTALGLAPDGQVWAVNWKEVVKYDGEKWSKVPVPWAYETATAVTTIAFGADGTVWVGFSFAPNLLDKCGTRMELTEESGIYRYDGKNWGQITTGDGLADNKICTMVPGPDGSMWVGTFDKGVSYYDGETWTNYTVTDFQK